MIVNPPADQCGEWGRIHYHPSQPQRAMYYAKEQINKFNGASTGMSDPIEYEAATSTGELFSHLQQQYGRCTGKVRIDRPGEEGVPVGWVFERRRQFADSDETFTEEVWVLLLEHDERTGFTQQGLRAT